MIFSLIKFELFLQGKQLVFWIACLAFLLFGLLLGSNGYAQDQVNFNSGYQIMYSMSLVTLVSVFAIMFFSIRGTLRDDISRMRDIVYSTPIKKKDFFIARFIGVYVASITAVSLTLLGFALGTLNPAIDISRLVEFNIWNYIQILLMTVVPTVLICASIIYSISILTKSSLATYASAIVIYALYFMCSAYFNSPLMARSTPPSPEGMELAALLDPLGISAFFEVTHYWTSFEKNNLMVSFNSNYGLNRAIWMCTAFLILLITYFRFDFRKPNIKAKFSEIINEPKDILYSKNITPNIRLSHFQSFKSNFFLEWRSLFKSKTVLALIMIWFVIVGTELYSRLFENGSYGDSLIPKTSYLIWIIEEPFFLVSLILTVFITSEIVWKSRQYNMNLISDALPITSFIALSSQILSVLIMPFLLLLSGYVLAIIFQLISGYSNLELDLYLGRLYYSVLPLFFYAMLSFFIFNIVNNKYLGVLIILLIILIFGTSVGASLGMYHPLLKLGRLPELAYSDMIGYGNYVIGFNWFMYLWVSLGLLLGLLAYRFWRRGLESFRSRTKKGLFGQWRRVESMTLIIILISLMLSATNIFYNINIIGDYETPKVHLDKRADYEKLFKQYDRPTQLIPVDVELNLDFFSSKRGYTAQGNFVLKNKSDFPVDTIMISERDNVKSLSLEGAELILRDSIRKVRIYKFEPPILPDELVKYSFEVYKYLLKFENNPALSGQSNYLQFNRIVPNLSYINSYEISNNYEREKRGLPEKEIHDEHDGHIHIAGVNYNKLNFTATVSSDSNQIPFAPGDRLKSWNEGNRNYSLFESSEPISPGLFFISGEYELLKEQYGNIEIEQYFAQGQDENVQRMMSFTKEALDYCQLNFGAYSFKRLTTIEVPSFWNFGGQAAPGLISMVEDRMYQVKVDSLTPFDLVAKRVIHEVAHQWWGHMLMPASDDGGDLFVEGLAKYTEAVVMNKVYGKRPIYQLCKTANETYFRGRSNSNDIELPLYINDNLSYLSYGKSLLSLMSLYQIIGEDKMNQAIKCLFDAQVDEIEPLLKSTDMIEAFYEVTPHKYHSLIDDWFKDMILYNQKIEDVIVNKLPSGQYELNVSIITSRKRVNDDGSLTSISFNEPVQMALLNETARLMKDEDIVYWESHDISGNENTIKLIVDKLPRYVAIDPLGYRPDQMLADNVFELKN